MIALVGSKTSAYQEEERWSSLALRFFIANSGKERELADAPVVLSLDDSLNAPHGRPSGVAKSVSCNLAGV